MQSIFTVRQEILLLIWNVMLFVIGPELGSEGDWLSPRPTELPLRWESWDLTQAERAAGLMHHHRHTAAEGLYGSHLRYHPAVTEKDEKVYISLIWVNKKMLEGVHLHAWAYINHLVQGGCKLLAEFNAYVQHVHLTAANHDPDQCLVIGACPLQDETRITATGTFFEC